MNLSMHLKADLLPKLRARYEGRGREGKTRMLNELCEDYGYERKYAIKLLRDTVPAPSGRAHPGPEPRYALIEPVAEAEVPAETKLPSQKFKLARPGPPYTSPAAAHGPSPARNSAPSRPDSRMAPW